MSLEIIKYGNNFVERKEYHKFYISVKKAISTYCRLSRQYFHNMQHNSNPLLSHLVL